MGLDISVYSNIKAIEGTLDDDYNLITDNDKIIDPDDFIHIYQNDHFKEQGEGLPEFIVRPTEKNFDFRAGSYGSYNAWRNQLARVAGYAQDKETGAYDQTAWKSQFGPFLYLINFSDCEGAINAKVSADLLKDFKNYEEQAAKEDERFYELYKNWMKAFEIASDNGVVLFW